MRFENFIRARGEEIHQRLLLQARWLLVRGHFAIPVLADAVGCERGAHPSKTAKGGAASFETMSAGYVRTISWGQCGLWGPSPETAKYFPVCSFARPASVRDMSNWRPLPSVGDCSSERKQRSP